MIKQVKDFIESFFQVELLTATASIRPDIENAEEHIMKFYEYCSKDCFNKMGFVIPVPVRDDDFYERRKNIVFTVPRHLFKISRYKNIKYGEAYFVFISTMLNEDTKKIFRMTECLIVAPIEGNYKIIGEALSDPDDRTKWDYSYGDPEFDFNSPGEFLEVERYVEPIHDKDKFEKFNRDE